MVTIHSKNLRFLFLLSFSLYFQLSNAQFEFDNIPIAPSPGEGMEWELQTAPSDDFNYVFDPNTSRVNFGPDGINQPGAKWYNTYHDLPNGQPNTFQGPGPTIWKPENIRVDGDLLHLFNTRVPGEEKNQFGNVYPYATRGGCMTGLTQVMYPVFIEARVTIANSTAASDVWLLSPDDTQEIDIIEAYGGAGLAGTVPGGNFAPAGRNSFFAERIHLSHHVFTRTPFRDYQPRDFNSFWRREIVDAWGGQTVDIGINWVSPTRIEYYIDGQLARVIDHTGIASQLENGTWQYTYPAGLVNTDGEIVSTNLGVDGQLLFDPNGFQSMSDQNCNSINDFNEDCLDDTKLSSNISVIDPFDYLDNGRQFSKPLDIIINVEDQSFQANAIPSRSPNDNEITEVQTPDQTMSVDWIRVYKPVPIEGGPSDRSRFLNFANRTSFIPGGTTTPQFTKNETITMEIDYRTAISNGMEEDLDYVAVQVRELDEMGNTVDTSTFTVAVDGSAPNTGTGVTFNYTIPDTFDGGAEIPLTSELDEGHQLLFLLFMQTTTPSGEVMFENDNGVMNLVDATELPNDRPRSISFANRADFIPDGATAPEFEKQQTITLEIDYQTAVVDGVVEDLDYVAVQVRELDELGNALGTSAFTVAIGGTSLNTGTGVNFDYTIPSFFDNGTEIPLTTELDEGHQLLLLLFMQATPPGGTAMFADDNDLITLTNAPPLDDRVRSLTLANRAEFIPEGAEFPQFEKQETVTLEIDYQTAVLNGVEEDLDYVAVQVRELDEMENTVDTSTFTVAVDGSSPNTGTGVTFNYTIPDTFDGGTEIPLTAELDDGHQLLFIIFMQATPPGGTAMFANDNGNMTLINREEENDNRDRAITFVNKSDFIPNGSSTPEFEKSQNITLQIDYQTAIVNDVEEDLDYVAVQVRELDEMGNTVDTSTFTVAVDGSAPNTGTGVTFNYTIPDTFDGGTEIPLTTELDDGHQLYLLLFMQATPPGGSAMFADDNNQIILNETTLSINSLEQESIIKIYPNPVDDILNITGKFNSWKIYSLQGSFIREGTSTTIEVSNLLSGLYFIELDHGAVFKLIKR